MATRRALSERITRRTVIHASVATMLLPGAFRVAQTDAAAMPAARVTQYRTGPAKEKHAHPEALHIVPTGLTDIDALTGGGLRRSEVMLLAGATRRVGKTALAITIGLNVARWRPPSSAPSTTYSRAVAFYSLGLPRNEIELRVLASGWGLPLTHLREKRLQLEARQQLRLAEQQFAATKFLVGHSPRPTIGHVSRWALRMKREHGVAAIIIDDLEHTQGYKTGESPERAVQIMKALKQMALELDLPVLVTVDADLMGDLPNHADSYVFLVRDQRPSGVRTSHFDPEEAQIAIFQQQHGPTCCVWIRFDSNSVKFEDIANVGEQPPWVLF